MIALAAAAGVAVENARLYEEAERRQLWLRATAEITALAGRRHPRAGTPSSWSPTAPERSPGRTSRGSSPGTTATPSSCGWSRASPPTSRRCASCRWSTRWRRRSSAPGRRSRSATSPPTRRAVDPSATLGWPSLGPAVVVPLGSRSRRGGRPRPRLDSRARRPGSTPWTRRCPTSFAEQAALALQIARSREDQQRLDLLEDRDRIGRDLHDLVIQRLFAVGLSLESAARLAVVPDVSARLERAVDELDGTIKDIRRTIFALGTMDATHRRADRDRADRGAGPPPP